MATTTKTLENKVALVTGASKGIGKAIAFKLAAQGASVVVNYGASKADAEQVVAKIREAGGKAVAVKANVAVAEEARALVAQAVQAFGPIDILVNNAGVFAFGPLEAINAEHFHRHFDINVLGLLQVTREAAANFNPAGGSVINVSSVVATMTPANAAVYVATKASVDAITRVLAKELAARHIRVNAVAPGMTLTEGLVEAGMHEGDARNFFESITPMGRVAQPEEVAEPVAFLASVAASYVTGEVLAAGGGLR